VPVRIAPRLAAFVGEKMAETWVVLRPFRNFDRVKPVFEQLEKTFDQYAPGWKGKLQLSGRERVGVIPLAVVLGITLKEAIIMGGVVVLAGFIAASTTMQKQLEPIARDISESERTSKPPPLKDPKGRQVDPWYVAPVSAAVSTAIIAVAAIAGLRDVLKKVPKIPSPPQWIWPIIILGGLGVAGYYVHRRT
jgi:hypothetical protein